MKRFDIGEIAIWAVVAVTVVCIKPAIKLVDASETDTSESKTVIAEVETETEATSYSAEISASENLLAYERETTEPETLADIETYLEAWSFAERVEETEETIGAGCFEEDLKNANSMSMDMSEADITALQKVAIAEASVDGVIGEALVIRVVLNRLYSAEFPNTISEVIAQDNQFTTYSNGTYETAVPDDTSREAWALVEGGWDESQGAMWFERTSEGDTWHNTNLTYLFSYGGHSFYTK